MTSPFLADDDVKRLTGRTNPSAQRRALDRMKIRYHSRPDGRPIIARAAVESDLAATNPAPAPSPNWSAI